MSSSDDNDLKKLPLDALHREHGAKMVPFAGYAMPVQYKDGIIAEHLHTRNSVSLFDVSHMGQVSLLGAGAAAALERLVPGDIQGLAAGHMRYTMFTNEQGGILDDLIITQLGDRLFMVLNAACKDADINHLRSTAAHDCTVEVHGDRALLALQGPKAAEVMSHFARPARHMPFLYGTELGLGGFHCFVTRSGYTGEDGYEISVPVEDVEELADLLLAEEDVKLAGLGARDTLRLEAGLCLYGNDIDETTTPVEAALAWTIQKRRREEGGFPGHDVIMRQIQDGTARKRVGFRLDGRAPARAHAEIVGDDGKAIGEVTSGAYGPTVEAPIAMGYVATEYSPKDTKVGIVVRGKTLDAYVTSPAFIDHRYHRVE